MRKNAAVIIFAYIFSLASIWSIERILTMWMIIEVNTLRFIGIILIVGGPRVEGALSYFLVQSVSSMIFLLCYNINIRFTYIIFANSLMVIIIVLKIGGAPLHYWVWGVASQMIRVILWCFLFLQKIIPLIVIELLEIKTTIIIIITVLFSLIVGRISNIRRNYHKRFIIFLGISSVRWLLASLLRDVSLWKLYLITFGIIRRIFFLQPKVVRRKLKTRGLISLVGLPPWPSFYPKLIIVFSILLINLTAIAIVIIIISVIEIFVILRTNQTRFLISTRETQKKTILKENKILLIWLTPLLIILFL